MSESSEQTSLAAMTAEIVAAYVSNNQTATADLARLITAVATQLSKVGAAPEHPAEEKPEAAVSVRRSVRLDHLVCLVCGQQRKTLKRHLAVRHDLSPAEYRERFGLKPSYPMAAPNYAQQRRDSRFRLDWVGQRSRRVAGHRSAVRPEKAEPSASATA